MFNKRAIQLQPYLVSERFKGTHNGDWLFLDWNETTYELLPNIKQKLKEAIDQDVVVSYPDGDRDDVLAAIGEFNEVPPEYILVFNGSDSALKDCIQCLLDPEDEISVVEPEYSQINTFVQMAASKMDLIKLKNPFEFCIEELIDSLKEKKFLYLSNPSNPTGRYLSRMEIIKILDTGICLLLDEAYVEFAPESCAKLVEKYTNLLIFRTFSKAFGLAGLRLGYVLSHSENINILKKNRNSKEINALANIAAKEALSSLEIFRSRIKEIIATRDNFISEINQLDQRICAFNSMANFVVVKTSHLTELISYLEGNKILIRDRRGMYFMDDCARVSVGTPDQMKMLINLLSDFFKNLR
jgi:histidinol-phosphate aminotransferase